MAHISGSHPDPWEGTPVLKAALRPTAGFGTRRGVDRPGAGYPEEAGTGGTPYDLSLDGQRFLMLRRINSADDPLVEARMVVVVNWLEELRAAVPAR